MYLTETIRDTIDGSVRMQTSNNTLTTDYEIEHYEDEESGLREQSIEKILVPVDGSQHSNHALEYAVDLAKRYFAEICLLHVIPIMPICSSIPYSLPFSPLYITESEKEGEKVLNSALNKVREAHVKSVAWLDCGRPAGRIIRAAKEESIDLIVMGSENHSLIAKLFLGSISDEVSHHAPCPVLIVKKSQMKNESTNREVSR